MPRHVIVDGSNIATEGRSKPSLQQLNDAVTSFMADNPDDVITVVVDATFGHRIDPSEVAEFDEAVANNELVAPPAGAIGRGDAFVLAIADKVGATILSNDSFQEFHGEYEWLFTEGRLIGGKPVPHVGWVWVERTPVRGPVSRRSTRGAKKGAAKAPSRRTASAEASKPMPVPKAPPPGPARRGKAAAAAERAEAATPAPAPAAGAKGSPVNELLPYLGFVEHHPVGSSVNAVVDSYSSHGAYVTIGDIRGYVPLRLMADPPPRSAREAMRVGDAVTLVVESYAPARRSIDLAVPHVASHLHLEPTDTPQPDEVREVAAEVEPAAAATRPAKKTPAKKTPAKRAPAKKSAPEKPPAKQAPAKKSAAKPAAAKKSAAAPAPGDDATAKQAAIAEAPAEPTPAKQAPAKRAAKRAPAKKAAAKKSAPAEQAAPVKRAPAKKSAAKKPAAKAAPAKRAPAKKSAGS